MAVVCVVWADVEGAPTDGKNQLVGDMLCLGGSLLFAIVTVLQEIALKNRSCPEYLAMLGFVGSVVSCTQTFFLEFGELVKFNWDAGAIILHLSFLSADYYTLIAGMYIFQFKFHALYLLSYLLAMVGVFLFSGRPRTSPPQEILPEPRPEALPQIVNDAVNSQDNVSMEYTVPTLDCIPIEGLEPPMSRDTTFTSFLGGHSTTNGAHMMHNGGKNLMKDE
ncbi:Solute carrier family 35 member F1 [Eumeta japonica]|uniref:Solute carrier family 35 member F1 n=1 Tax=Eumeta variegata TaxID=151549 RepID=A0A4C1UPQ6_EUMVA|nr:Solute carrier family 35 member F1 [Eumeta japonica]